MNSAPDTFWSGTMCERRFELFGQTEMFLLRLGNSIQLVLFLCSSSGYRHDIYDAGRPGPAPGPIQAEITMGIAMVHGRHTYIHIHHPAPFASSRAQPLRGSHGPAGSLTMKLFATSIYLAILLATAGEVSSGAVDPAFLPGLQAEFEYEKHRLQDEGGKHREATVG